MSMRCDVDEEDDADLSTVWVTGPHHAYNFSTRMEQGPFRPGYSISQTINLAVCSNRVSRLQATIEAHAHLTTSLERSRGKRKCSSVFVPWTFQHVKNYHVHAAAGQMPPSSTYANAAPVYVTPTMWQEAVASSIPDGLKRRWDDNASITDQSMYKRAR